MVRAVHHPGRAEERRRHHRGDPLLRHEARRLGLDEDPAPPRGRPAGHHDGGRDRPRPEPRYPGEQMKLTLLRFVALAALCAAAPAGADDGVLLRMKFKEGEVRRYRMSSKVDLQMAGQPAGEAPPGRPPTCGPGRKTTR